VGVIGNEKDLELHFERVTLYSNLIAL